MRFSTRTRYGLRFLLRLAVQPPGILTELRQIAEKENISCGYLEQMVHALKPLGILRAVRGMGGGYALAKPPAEIPLEPVFECLEGDLAPVACVAGGKNCQRECLCSTREFWLEMDVHIRVFLKNKTLQTLLDANQRRLTGERTHVGL
ncbi:MAG: Rrf2 family transcriptional regulator [Desulfovibrio sp.]|nr:Rrf2 family transcriptional regulator [Desulfovibrio sp.]